MKEETTGFVYGKTRKMYLNDEHCDGILEYITKDDDPDDLQLQVDVGYEDIKVVCPICGEMVVLTKDTEYPEPQDIYNEGCPGCESWLTMDRTP